MCVPLGLSPASLEPVLQSERVRGHRCDACPAVRTSAVTATISAFGAGHCCFPWRPVPGDSKAIIFKGLKRKHYVWTGPSLRMRIFPKRQSEKNKKIADRRGERRKGCKKKRHIKGDDKCRPGSVWSLSRGILVLPADGPAGSRTGPLGVGPHSRWCFPGGREWLLSTSDLSEPIGPNREALKPMGFP